MTQGVEFNRLMLQMRSMQMEAMSRPQPPVQLEQNVKGPAFENVLKQAVDKVSEMQSATGSLQDAYARGVPGVDLTEVMIAAQKSSVAFQAVTQVRNKMVNAYESIMNMPI